MTDQPLVEPRERQGSERPTDPGGQLCPRWQRGGRLDLEAHRPGAWRVADAATATETHFAKIAAGGSSDDEPLVELQDAVDEARAEIARLTA